MFRLKMQQTEKSRPFVNHVVLELLSSWFAAQSPQQVSGKRDTMLEERTLTFFAKGFFYFLFVTNYRGGGRLLVTVSPKKRLKVPFIKLAASLFYNGYTLLFSLLFFVAVEKKTIIEKSLEVRESYLTFFAQGFSKASVDNLVFFSFLRYGWDVEARPQRGANNQWFISFPAKHYDNFITIVLPYIYPLKES